MTGPDKKIELLRVENLDVGYDRVPVVQEMNFTIQKGEITVLLGRSGCGKSTVLKTVIGLIPPMNGDIYFWGEPLDMLSEHAMQRVYEKIGVLYQNSALLNSLTLFENVALPIKMQFPEIPDEIEREMVSSRLAQVGLAGSGEKFPSELSGGMRKRAALARAMILDPDIIFCDEPSAGLDPITSADLDKLMLNLRDMFGITFVVVTHELRSIENIADRAIVLNKGVIHFNGTLNELHTSRDSFINTFFMRK